MSMQRTHKFLQDHRPPQIKIKPLMFQSLKRRIIHKNSNQSQQEPRQNALQSQAKQNAFIHLSKLQSQIRGPNSHSLQSVASKRLKLKDYLRLNEITRQKRSLSSKTIKMSPIKNINSSAQNPQEEDQTTHKRNLSQTFNPQVSNINSASITFNPRDTFSPQGKISKKPQKKQIFQQEIKLTKLQLLNALKKAKQNIIKMTDLIQSQDRTQKSYKDIVFMFRVQEIINNQIIKGVQKINAAYIQRSIEHHNMNTVEENTENIFQMVQASQKKDPNEQIKASKNISLNNESLRPTSGKLNKSQILPISTLVTFRSFQNDE